MMCFLENISQKLIRLHRRLVVACSAPSSADGVGGKTVESPPSLGVMSRCNNSLAKLFTVITVSTPSHGSPLSHIITSPDTFRQDEDKK